MLKQAVSQTSALSSSHRALQVLYLTALTLSAILLLSVHIARAEENAEAQWVPGEYIISYDLDAIHELKRRVPDLGGYTDQAVTAALTELLGAEKLADLPLIGAEGIRATDADIDVITATDLLDGELASYISPNYLRSANRVPNDPSFSSLWGLNQANDIDIDAPEAWDGMSEDAAKDIIVGVVDTGIDYNHPDLAANVWSNSAEANGIPGVDDDGNGVVDDIHGFNAITNAGNPADDHSHGTHVSGTIGAVGNNSVGVTGVAWKVKIMGLKFLGANGSGCDIDAIEAIEYAVSMRNRYGRLKVLNNSWGGGGYDPALEAAIKAANDAGILFVAAAGNSAADNDRSGAYPANYNLPNVVSVAAVAADGSKASFSNYGQTKVHLAAPGVGVLSTTPGSNYASYSGTSMATPHVSGVAALAFSRAPQLAPEEVRALLLATVKPDSQLQGLMAAPGIVSAQNAAADPSNYPPELQPIADQLLRSVTRVQTVPLVVRDRENDPLTYEAEIVMPLNEVKAASIDQQLDLVAYLPEKDNYWKIGEKWMRASNNDIFWIFADGTVWKYVYPYYIFFGSVHPSYYDNPSALVNAYPLSTAEVGSVQIIPGSPYELRITAAKDSGSFIVAVTVSDGNRSDIRTFNVTVGEPESCS